MAAQQEERHVPGLRVISFVPDVPELDIYANGELLYEGVGQVDPHVDALPLPEPENVTPETTVEIAAVPSGERPENALATTAIETGGWEGMAQYGYSVFAVGEACAISNREAELVVVEDDHSKTRAGYARFRAGHASPDLPTVDIRTEGEDGTTLLEGGGFGESNVAEIPAGEGVLAVLKSEGSREPIARWEINPREGHVYTGWVIGYRHLDAAPADVSEQWNLGMAISDDSKPGVE